MNLFSEPHGEAFARIEKLGFYDSALAALHLIAKKIDPRELLDEIERQLKRRLCSPLRGYQERCLEQMRDSYRIRGPRTKTACPRKPRWR